MRAFARSSAENIDANVSHARTALVGIRALIMYSVARYMDCMKSARVARQSRLSDAESSAFRPAAMLASGSTGEERCVVRR